jgi:transcriptional regulator with XRE-family HTH domain
VNTPFLRRRLGRRLRALRERAGMNLDEASRRLDKKRSSLHRVEMGETSVRAMFAGSRRKRSKEKVDNDIKVRVIRKQRLTAEDDLLELVAIVDEAALRREVGGPAVMRKQFGHLIDMAALRSVTIQVLPLGGGAHSAMDGAFTLLSFPEPKDPDLLYVEHTAGALHIEDSAKLREARLIFDQFRTEALSPVDSIELISRMAP